MDSKYDAEGAPPDVEFGSGYTIPDGRLSQAILLDEAEDVLLMGPTARCKSHREWVDRTQRMNVHHTTPSLCDDYHSCISKCTDKNDYLLQLRISSPS